MDGFVPLAVAGSLVWSAVKVLKYATNKAWEPLGTLVVVHVVGVAVAFLLAASDFAGGISVGGIALADLNAASTVLFGVALASAAAAAYDVRKSIDGTDSAVEPSLFHRT